MDPKLIDSARGLIFGLTWKRIAMLFVLLVLAGLAVLFWLNREYISGAVKPATISPEKQELIVNDNGKKAIAETLARASYSMNTIMIVQMNMERNTRRVIYFTSLDPEIQRQRDIFEQTHATTDVPIFNDDPLNNKRIIGYINGEFICTDFQASQASRFLTNVNVKAVCATAVPPIYGKFRGTVVAMLKNVPDAEEQTRLKILMRDLANQLDNPSSSK